MNKLLWVLQVLLALFIAFSGVTKLMMPAEQLTAQSTFSASFLRFIGVAEIFGAIGLVVPWLTRIKPWLTPLAAALLMIILIGAVVTTVTTMSPAFAIVPLVTLIFTAFVAWGRWRITPPASRAAEKRAPLAV
jgi:hypothetical protein